MILITGGMGFIGMHVAKRFLDAGEDVILMQHQARREPALFTRDYFKVSFVCHDCGRIEKRIIDERASYHPFWMERPC